MAALLPVSVIVPVYNQAALLRLALQSIRAQEFEDYELVVVDDASTDGSAQVAHELADRVIVNERNLGPGRARNRAIRDCKGELLVFMDSDCEAQPGWLRRMVEAAAQPGVDIAMGRVTIPPASFLGDCISTLGFPAGGSLGFEKMWHVDESGFTDHMSSCNFSVRKEVFERYGFFDEGLDFYCEDAEFSERLVRAGGRIRFIGDGLVHHVAREKLAGFITWQLLRGRGAYHFRRRVGPVDRFVKLRLWSCGNVIRANLFSPRIFLVLPLLALSFVLQQAGFVMEKRRVETGPQAPGP